jgi:hypothetical protein
MRGVLGAMGIFLAVIIAPVRGDAWGFAGLTLIPIGLIICYFSGGFFVVHLAPLNPAIIDPVISGYPTRSAPRSKILDLLEGSEPCRQSTTGWRLCHDLCRA